ncbi:T9SS type A sorting domain-containing protein [Rhizobium leguminosarum]
MFDARGIRLKTLTVKENAHFDLSKFPSGIYYIRIASENKTFKILKQ